MSVRFPDAVHETPLVFLVQFADEETASHRPIHTTCAALRVGDRVYVNVAPFGQQRWLSGRIERLGVHGIHIRRTA